MSNRHNAGQTKDVLRSAESVRMPLRLANGPIWESVLLGPKGGGKKGLCARGSFALRNLTLKEKNKKGQSNNNYPELFFTLVT